MKRLLTVPKNRCRKSCCNLPFIFLLVLFTFGVVHLLSAVSVQYKYGKYEASSQNEADVEKIRETKSIIRNVDVETQESEGEGIEMDFQLSQGPLYESVIDSFLASKNIDKTQNNQSQENFSANNLSRDSMRSQNIQDLFIHKAVKPRQWHIYRQYNGTTTRRKIKESQNVTVDANKVLARNQHQRSKTEKRRYLFSNHSENVSTREKNVNKHLGKADIVLNSLFDDPIKRAVSPSSGEVWPQTHFTITYPTTVYRLLANHFQFLYDKREYRCDILDQAIKRYMQEIEDFHQYNLEMYEVGAPMYTRKETSLKYYQFLYNVTIVINQKNCLGQFPSSDMDESYTLQLMNNSTPALKANTIWGLLRGLETFYQLLYIPLSYDMSLHIRSVDVTDKPDMSYRGILVDTSRHFISITVLKENLDAMAQNKMNVMHWHIVDDQSFPYQSKKFPELSRQGAFAPHLVYTQRDVSDVIGYARMRGIRVVPEFDSPGHTRSWLGQPGLMAECGENKMRDTGVFDVTKASNYDFLSSFFSEVRSVFKDDMLHLGGDEVSVKCWYLNKNILRVLENKTHNELIGIYFKRLYTILKKIDRNWKTIVWNEVPAKYFAELDPSQTIVEVWQNTLQQVLSKGFDVIYAKCWYMDHVKGERPDWYAYYDCDPRKESHGMKGPGRILGGEACMWAEWVDDNNMIQRLWPRAIATAERLWSAPKLHSSHINVQARFQEQSCRMARRGIRVSPVNGPGHCSGRMPFDKDTTFSYKQISSRQG